MALPEMDIYDADTDKLHKKLGRRYGISMGSKERKGQGNIYLRDWLKAPVGIDAKTGRTKMRLHLIYDIALIDEFIRYSDDGNFDRVSSMRVGMMYQKALYNKEVELVQEEMEEESIFNRSLF